jgi:enterochelin esterase-like enzyme
MGPRPQRRLSRALSLLLLPLLLPSLPSPNQPTHAQSAPPQRVISPEIGPEATVTFRLRAPQAESVRLTSGGDLPQIPFGQTLPLARGDGDVWELTLSGVDPGTYRYAFVVDAVTVVDPAHAGASRSNDNVWSLLHVPGAGFMDTTDVAHGAVAEVRYRSAELDRFRRMHVYTPPDYGLSQRRYPVLYLLHGAMDSDDSWHTVGRAADILDNLIAARRAEPMIVVMPHGHSGPFTMGAGPLPLDEFVREFERDIEPYVRRNYLVRTDRDSTAIAGLSMGGAQTLEIAVRRLGDFGYVGVFSSGVFGAAQSDEWERRYRAQLADAGSRRGLKLLWFATGEEDFLLETTEATVELFRRHGFDVTYRRTGGGHTWINWREYLHELAPHLFK